MKRLGVAGCSGASSFLIGMGLWGDGAVVSTLGGESGESENGKVALLGFVTSYELRTFLALNGGPQNHCPIPPALSARQVKTPAIYTACSPE